MLGGCCVRIRGVRECCVRIRGVRGMLCENQGC